MNLKTKIYDINLESCIMNASGCWCTTAQELDDLNTSKSGAIVSKSGTVMSREGNPMPRFYNDTYGSINSMGLPNLGYEFYYGYSFYAKLKKPFIQSIHPLVYDDLDIMFKTIKTRNLLEVNISCPNLVDGIENTFEKYEKYMDRLNQERDKKCGMKLAPFFELGHFDVMSRLLLKYNIKFITCINSISNGLIVDYVGECTRILPKNGLGGIGGLYCKPTALANVYNFYKRLGNNIDIIGCGGISSGVDAFEHILCGAKAVQVGTHLIKAEPMECFNNLEMELFLIMKRKNYTCIDDFMGKIRMADNMRVS
jgi:dihydroorotate dehydrogenase (fumarate)